MGEARLVEIVMLLLAAVIVVPVSKRLGFGAVLGYLAAGVVMGPWALGVIADVENMKSIAELGVVFLLFVIGLELQLSRLWALRESIFGYGTAQVLITSALFACAGIAVGLGMATAVVVGLALSLSSTAFALQL